MTRFMQVVLLINIALAAFFAFTGYILHVGPEGGIGAAEPILARAQAAVVLGFVLTLAVGLPRFQRDPIWLLVPVFFLLPLLLDALYELSAGTGDIPPAIIRAILIACYVAGYVALRRTSREDGASEAPAGREADAAAR